MPDPQPAAPASSPRPVALVAGGSRGLGLLIARELAACGHLPVVCARDPEGLRRAEAWLARSGHEVRTEVCDVSDAEAVSALVSRVESEIGPVEVALHVAGVIQVGPLECLTRQHFEEAADIMLWGPINVALAVLEGMKARGRGRIGIVTSIGGMVSVPHLLPYSVAKFGAVGFSQGLRAELAGTGVTVTTIVPGLMRTGSHLHAQFAGNHTAEYAWFAPGASLPLISVDAERAAAKITAGVLRGRGVVLLTPLAKVGARFNGLAPSTTGLLMGVMGRLLPNPPEGTRPVGTMTGHQAREHLHSRLVEALTTLGTRAAERFNQLPPR